MSQLLGPTALCAIGALGFLLVVFLINAVKIVPEYQRLVIFRFGRVRPVPKPGITLLFPVIDRAVRVDLREQVREVPHQTSITKDNAPISIDFIWYFQVLDPAQSVLQVTNFESAAAGIAGPSLRSVIGSMSLDEVLSEREHINTAMRSKLDESTEKWGVKVTKVEIREIIPPRDVQDAMNRQMSAERIRRAVVTESEGTRAAAINVAEGEKQSNILRAEGQKQSAILQAEGERQAQLLRAEGFAQALDAIFNSAKGIDQKTMTLQYFETLKSIGASPSTKYIFPMEFTSMLENFIGKK